MSSSSLDVLTFTLKLLFITLNLPHSIYAQQSDTFQIVGWKWKGENRCRARFGAKWGPGKRGLCADPGRAFSCLSASSIQVIIVDKTENNSLQVNGHPAWGAEYTLSDNSAKPIDVVSNSFCGELHSAMRTRARAERHLGNTAGGSHLADGRFVNVGGNPVVNNVGVAGGKAVRVYSPDARAFVDNTQAMPLSRWYPTVETLETGDVIFIGGELEGSFVNTPEAGRNVPTYEYWPSRGTPQQLDFLVRTMPANLFPLTWLLPDGRLFMQAGWETIILDHRSNTETRLPNMSHAQRLYPASAANVMLPLTVANDFTPTILMCGGFNPPRDDWNQNLIHFPDYQASDSCVSIQPLSSNPTWLDEDEAPEPRSMGSFIILPDGRLLIVQGAGYGVSGYGFDGWAVGQSYATSPVYRPAYYDPSAPRGSRWSSAGVSSSTIARMYHSTALLLPDGSIFLASSNPNLDVITPQNNASYPYKTEYRSEKFFPTYFASPRPQPSGIPSAITYGGSPFSIELPASSVTISGDLDQVIRVALIRTGFQTHAIGIGQKYIQLVHSHTSHSDGSVTLHVSPLPPNPAVFSPGPALVFVVINGVPSIGVEVIVGSGRIGSQPTQSAVPLPSPSTDAAARKKRSHPRDLAF